MVLSHPPRGSQGRNGGSPQRPAGRALGDETAPGAAAAERTRFHGRAVRLAAVFGTKSVWVKSEGPPDP